MANDAVASVGCLPEHANLMGLPSPNKSVPLLQLSALVSGTQAQDAADYNSKKYRMANLFERQISLTLQVLSQVQLRPKKSDL